MHLLPVLINVRCYSNSDMIVLRSEVNAKGHNPTWRNRGVPCRTLATDLAIEAAALIAIGGPDKLKIDILIVGKGARQLRQGGSR